MYALREKSLNLWSQTSNFSDYEFLYLPFSC
nr:MAG TPA: hypothetical protein [Caudoviricetes sp.]